MESKEKIEQLIFAVRFVQMYAILWNVEYRLHIICDEYYVQTALWIK
jgi:hypothetical protein